MIEIKALQTGKVISLDVSITKWSTVHAATSKAIALGEGIEKSVSKSDVEYRYSAEYANIGGVPKPDLSDSLTSALLASVLLPTVQLRFAQSIPGSQLESQLSALGSWIHPSQSANRGVDPLTSPISVWWKPPTKGQNARKDLIAAGILLELQYSWQPRGPLREMVLQGEMTVMDCRLDSDFLSALGSTEL